MNSLCGHCGTSPTKFCLCGQRVTLLCDMCTAKHESYYTTEIHDYSPVSYYSVLQGLGIEGFRMQKLQVINGISFMHRLQDQENRQYEQAKQDLQDAYNTYYQWLDFLHNRFLALVQKFEQEKTVPMISFQYQLSAFTYYAFSQSDRDLPPGFSLVESGPVAQFKRDVEELQQKLYRNCGAMNDYEQYFIEAIKGGLQGQSTPQRVPSTPQMVPSSPMQQSIPIPQMTQQVSVRQSSYNLQAKQFTTYIPFSRGTVLAKWNTRTGTLDKVNLSRRLNITKHSVSVVLPSGDLCVCGGINDNGSLAVVIDGLSGTVYDLGSLKSDRGCAGLVYCYEWLFIFGGYGGNGNDLKSAEKYSLKGGTSWMPVKNDMANTRHQFTPAVHERLVYIAGGLQSTTVETFHVVHETFRNVPITLPKAHGTIALVHNNELLILQDRKLIRWRLGTDQANVVNLAVGVIESNVGPQTFGNKVFFNKETDAQCEIFVLELDKMSVTMLDGLKSSGGDPCQLQ